MPAETITFIYSGDKTQARNISKYGLLQLAILQKSMSFNNLTSGTRTLNLPDGTKIHCRSERGLNTVTIHVPPMEAKAAERLAEERIGSYFYIYVNIGGSLYVFGLKYIHAQSRVMVKYIQRCGNTINKGTAFAIGTHVYSKEVDSEAGIDLKFDLSITQVANGTIYVQYDRDVLWAKSKPSGAHSHTAFYDHEEKCLTYVVVGSVDTTNREITYTFEKYFYDPEDDLFEAEPSQTDEYSVGSPESLIEPAYPFELYRDLTKDIAPADYPQLVAQSIYHEGAWKVILRNKIFGYVQYRGASAYAYNVKLSHAWMAEEQFQNENHPMCWPEYDPAYPPETYPEMYKKFVDYALYYAIASHVTIDPYDDNAPSYLRCGTSWWGSPMRFMRFVPFGAPMYYNSFKELCVASTNMHTEWDVECWEGSGSKVFKVSLSTSLLRYYQYNNPPLSGGPIAMFDVGDMVEGAENGGRVLAQTSSIVTDDYEYDIVPCDEFVSYPAYWEGSTDHNQDNPCGLASMCGCWDSHDGTGHPWVNGSVHTKDHTLIANSEVTSFDPSNLIISDDQGILLAMDPADGLMRPLWACFLDTYYGLYVPPRHIPYINTGSSYFFMTAQSFQPETDWVGDESAESEPNHVSHYVKCDKYYNESLEPTDDCQEETIADNSCFNPSLEYAYSEAELGTFVFDEEATMIGAYATVKLFPQRWKSTTAPVVIQNIPFGSQDVRGSGNFFNSIECENNHVVAFSMNGIMKCFYSNYEPGKPWCDNLDFTTALSQAVLALKQKTANGPNPVTGDILGIYWCPFIPKGYTRIPL